MGRWPCYRFAVALTLVMSGSIFRELVAGFGHIILFSQSLDRISYIYIDSFGKVSGQDYPHGRSVTCDYLSGIS